MITVLYIALGLVAAIGSLSFRLAKPGVPGVLGGRTLRVIGFFIYLDLADVAVPLLGTDFVETPALEPSCSIVHFILFFCCVSILASSRSRGCEANARQRGPQE